MCADPLTSFGRAVARGVARFRREHSRSWRVLAPPRFDGRAVALADAIVAQLEDAPHLASGGAALVVGVAQGSVAAPFPVVAVDNDAVAGQAAEHLSSAGALAFACVGYRDRAWSDERLAAFAGHRWVAGARCDTLRVSLRRSGSGIDEDSRSELRAWLRTLPRPLGVFAADDAIGAVVLQAARELSLDVPREIAVVGVGDDDLTCELADVALSSVRLDGERMGELAAALVDERLRNERAPRSARVANQLVGPAKIVVRASSDRLVFRDPLVATALRLIAAHACDGISAKDVIARIPASRRVLEKRFRAAVGRTIHAEILDARLARVKHLLRTTDSSLAEISEQTGFLHVEHLSRLFKKKVGCAPRAYRQRSPRLGATPDPPSRA